MTSEEKKLLQAKHRLEEAQARDRVKERKARTRRLIQEGALLEKVLPEVQAVGAEYLGGDLRGKAGFPFLYPKGALTHHPKGQWYFLRKSCALRGGCGCCGQPLDKAAFFTNCQPCPRSRRRGFHSGTPCSWGGISPPHPAACLRQLCPEQIHRICSAA